MESICSRPRRAHVRRVLLTSFIALALIHFAGCGKPGGALPPVTEAAGKHPKRFPFKGEIIGIERERGRLIVKHEEIPGYMPAMTMEFIVSPGDLANAREGQHISAEMVTNEGDDYLLEKIWPADPVASTNVAAATAALLQDTTIRGRNAYREVGEITPTFSLYDQSGAVVQSERFRGRQVLINFIFTRCPVANMCPLAVSKFQQVQAKARKAGISNLELISISLDPAFDTPGVLRDYASARGIDTSNYSFLTGPEAAIRALLTQFGVIAEFKGELLNHTLATILVNEKGMIVWRADGSSWSVDEFVGKMDRPGENKS
ncbi:MAG: SCO family protein [Opitutaceae bacterium]|nr:SCO family protein [Opitutaceae bacterium]